MRVRWSIAAVVVAVVAATVVWWVTRPEPTDEAWVQARMPVADDSREETDDSARKARDFLIPTFGDADVIQHGLRDGRWTDEGFDEMLARVDLATTSRATAGDTERRFLLSTADTTAEIVSRSLAAIALRDDRDEIAERFASDGDATGSTALAHLLGAWSTIWFIDAGVTELNAQPDAFTASLETVDEVAQAPIVSDAWLERTLPLAVSSREGAATLAGGLEVSAIREARLARDAQRAALDSRLGTSSMVGSSSAWSIAESWAEVGHALTESSPGSQRERESRLSNWIDLLGEMGARVGDRPAATSVGDDPIAFAVFEAAVAPWRATDLEQEAASLDDAAAAERLDRARVLMLVAIIDAADAWDQRPAGFKLPAWSDVVEMDARQWEEVVGQWQQHTPQELTSGRTVTHLNDVLTGAD